MLLLQECIHLNLHKDRVDFETALIYNIARALIMMQHRYPRRYNTGQDHIVGER